jgi:hypothetical protein
VSRFYDPDLTTNPDSSFVRDAACSAPNTTLVMVMTRYEDAVREGLLRRYQSPQDDIKVFQISSTEEAGQDTVLH